MTKSATADVPETPDGWTGPRDYLEAGEKWHTGGLTGGGIYTRNAYHPEAGLHIVWNPNHDEITVGIERVEEDDEYGTLQPIEKLESQTFDTDEEALEALPEMCEKATAKYDGD